MSVSASSGLLPLGRLWAVRRRPRLVNSRQQRTAVLAGHDRFPVPHPESTHPAEQNYDINAPAHAIVARAVVVARVRGVHTA